MRAACRSISMYFLFEIVFFPLRVRFNLMSEGMEERYEFWRLNLGLKVGREN